MGRWGTWDWDTTEAISALVVPGETGVFVSQTDAGYERNCPRSGVVQRCCYVCGQPTGDGCRRFLLDRHTDEVLDPSVPEMHERGIVRAIGPECESGFAGLSRYAIPTEVA